MGKAERIMMGDEMMNKVKKGTATPSPNDYDMQKDYTLPNLGKGGGSLMASLADRVTTIAEAQAGGHATPGPSYQVPEQNVFKKRSESV